MNKTSTTTAAQNDALDFAPLFGGSEVKLVTTPRAVTPFGGLVSFLGWLGEIGFARQVSEAMPFAYRSPNAIPLAHTLTAFLLAVILGARRFAHSGWLRFDKALHALLGIARFPSDDAIRDFFHQFTPARIEAFWRPLWRWLLSLLSQPSGGFTLDLDSTIFNREGQQQQGALKGYNPRRPGRNSHHPLLAVLAEAPFILHAWLRSGNTSAGRGVVAFLREALAQLPAGWKLRSVRADSGFFDQHLFAFLEEQALPYVIVARMTKEVKRRVQSLRSWTEVGNGDYAIASFTARLFGWSTERRFVVVRERVREQKQAVGRTLLEVPGYTFRVWVTNRADDPLTLWRDYNLRATIEQRIEELKNDLHADGFCTRAFYATESAFLAVLFAFNLLSVYQARVMPQSGYRQPATLRAAVFVCGAILGRVGRQAVVRLSESGGGLQKHKPLIEAALRFLIPIPPLFEARSAPLDLSGFAACEI